MTSTDTEDFDAPVVNEIAPEDALILTLDGFEGPLDLLLALARTQKVDIARISILALADQYLEFMESVRKTNLELAADYLVMAAWLAFLKSRLVLPQPPAQGEPTADEMAAALRWRLQRLEVMRKAGLQLMESARLERDVFARGHPEPVVIEKIRKPTDNIYDLLSAYARERIRRVSHQVYDVVRARFTSSNRRANGSRASSAAFRTGAFCRAFCRRNGPPGGGGVPRLPAICWHA